GATVRRPSRVPWEYLTGAGVVGRSQDCSFEGGCTVIVLEREAGLNRGWRVRGTGGAAPAERLGAIKPGPGGGGPRRRAASVGEAGLHRGWRVRGTGGSARGVSL